MIVLLALLTRASASVAPERLVTWSSEHDAVVVVEPAEENGERHLTVLLADHATSAPVADAAVRVSLRGPAAIDADADSHGLPGHYDMHVRLDATGPWEGGITVLTEDRSDVVGLPAFSTDEAHDHDHDGHPYDEAVATAPSWGLLAAVGGSGLVLGLLLGRRRAVPAVVALMITTSRAHDGDDHGVLPAPTLTADGGVPLGLDRQFLLGLRTAVAQAGEARATTRVLGEVVAAPGLAALVQAPAAGVLRGPVPQVGAAINAGALLGQIDATGADRAARITAVADAEARVTAAREALVLAEADLARAEGLDGALAAADRERRTARVTTARADVDAANAVLLAAQDARRSTLMSPLSSTVATWFVQPGDTLQAGDPVVRLVAPGDRQLRLGVPEHAATDLRAGDYLTFVLASDPATPFDATVLDPGATVDPSTGQRIVTAAATDASPSSLPGASVRAWLPDGPAFVGLRVPESAVLHGAGEPFVIVKTGPETFALRPVVPGPRLGPDRAIRAGLEAGERVVTTANAPLRALLGR